MKQLTKAEEQVMNVLWTLKNGLLMEIVENMPPPQPHKNTVATILKTMIDKGFVRIEYVGRYHRYYPVFSRRAYTKGTLTKLAINYFEGSFNNIVSFLVNEKKMSVKDLEQLVQELKNPKK